MAGATETVFACEAAVAVFPCEVAVRELLRETRVPVDELRSKYRSRGGIGSPCVEARQVGP